MAVVSRIATLRLDDNTTHTTNILQWVATAAVQDTPSGGSVVITIVRTSLGVPPQNPNTLTLNLYNDSGTLIRAFTLDVATASQTVTFHFTNDGTSTGTARGDLVEIAIRATRTSTPSYDVETDGSPNTAPATFDTHLDRGWIRGTLNATTVISNVALGGAKTTAAYDDSLFVRTTLSAALYVARALTVAISNTTPALSGATNSATSGNFDATLANVVDNRFPAAVTTVNTSLTVPNATLTGQPATVLTATNDSISVDPRISFTKLLQLNDSAFGTPPISKNNIRGQRLTTELGMLAARATNARGEGVNGLAWTEKLWDNGFLVGTEAAPVKTRAAVATTQGGEAGWSDAFLTWDNQLPRANWTHKLVITTADAVGLELSNTRTVILLSINPNLIPVLGGGPIATASHWSPGQPLYIHMSLHDHTEHSYAVVDASPAPGVHVYRHNTETRKDQALELDGVTWTNVLDSDAPRHSLVAGVDDPNVYSKTFTAEQTAGWGYHDLHLIGHINNNSTPYASDTVIQVLGIANDHAGHGLDPLGLAVSGVLSLR